MPEHLSNLNNHEWRELRKIIGYCKEVQAEYSVIHTLEVKRRKHVEALKEICRKCKDYDCERRVDWQIKKAFDLLR